MVLVWEIDKIMKAKLTLCSYKVEVDGLFGKRKSEVVGFACSKSI